MTYTVEPAAGSERESIVALWRRNLPEAAAERYGWLYDSGPAESRLLQAADGRIVGSAGIMARNFYFDGRPIAAGQAIDLNVDKEHRTIGPALALQRAVVEQVRCGPLQLLYGFPNSSSEGVLRRVGYRPIGTVDRWVKMLRWRPYLESRFNPRWPLRAMGRAMDAATYVSGGEWLRRKTALRVESLVRFDRRFDDFNAALCARPGIIGERSADYLNWRFGGAPGGRREILASVDAGGALSAYLVYCRQGQSVSIGDFVGRCPQELKSLTAEFVRRMRDDGTASISVTCIVPTSTTEVFSALGFWRRPSRWQALVYAGESLTSPSGRLLDRANWYLTRADFDTDD